MVEPTNISLPDQRLIANKAIVLLGSSKRIENLSDRDGADAENLMQLWDIARRSTLALHPWNFALARARVERDAVAPIGADFAFSLPADCVRWLPWDRSQADWFDAVEEGGKLLCRHDGAIVVRYIRDVTEAAKWSPLFVDTISYTLAIEYCEGKTKLQGLRDRLTQERNEKLSQAKRVDGLASPNRARTPSVGQSRWAGARYRPQAPTWR